MGFVNTPEKYGSVTKFFHWSIMLLFLFQFATMIYFRFLEENPTDLTWKIMNWHKTSGLLILILGTMRYIWRKTSPLPDWPSNFTSWDIKVSHFAEWGLYASIFLMTITGVVIEVFGGYYINFFGWFHVDSISPFIHSGDASYETAIVAERKKASIPMLHDVLVAVHVLGAYAVVTFVSVHVMHVIRHQVVMKDRLLNRMLPSQSKIENKDCQ